MRINFKWFFLTVAVLVVIVIIGFQIRSSASKSQGLPVATSTGSVTKNGVTGTGDFTVEELPVENPGKATMPDLSGPVIYDKSFQGDARSLMAEKINDAIAKARQNPASYDIWFDLGADFKQAGDYNKAALAWEYALSLNAKDPVIYSNLGNLYGYYLKNYVKAEQDFQKSIELEPVTVNWYVRAAAFYSEVLKDPVKAREVLYKGLAQMPDDPALKAALSSLGGN